MPERVGVESFVGTDGFEQGMSTYLRGLDKMNTATDKFAQGATTSYTNMSKSISNGLADTALNTSRAMNAVVESIGGVIAKFAAIGTAVIGLWKLIEGLYKLMSSSLNAAARVQELDYVMQIMGRNAGITNETLQEQTKGIIDMGIRSDEARQAVITFMQSELDVSKAAQLARVAQDGAVIAATDSSAAFQRLTYAISRMDPQMLRSMGITVESTEVYDAYAKELGKTAGQLTVTEKKQAYLNAVLEEGKKIAGAYEAAMETPGKQMRSLARDLYELSRVIGEPFILAFGNVATGLRELAKGAKAFFDEGGPLRDLMMTLGAIAASITEKFKNFAKAFNNAIKQFNEEGTGPIRDFVDWFHDTFDELITKAFEWGSAIIEALADGIIQGISGVLNAIAWVGGAITDQLEAHSPPKFLPDLEKWGASAMTSYMEGWKNADFSVFNEISRTISSLLKSTQVVGGKDSTILERILGTREAVTGVLNTLRDTGEVASDAVSKIVAAAGTGKGVFSDYVAALLKAEVAGRKVQAIQEEMVKTANKYNEKISKLNEELQALTQGEEDKNRLAEIDRALSSGLLTSAEKERLEKERKAIALKAEIAATEKQRDTELKAMEEKLKAAAEQYNLSKEQLDMQKQLVAAQTEQNTLLREYMTAQQSKGGGGGGGGEDDDEEVPLETGIEDALKAKLLELQQQLEKQWNDMWIDFGNTLYEKLQPIRDAWDDVKTAWSDAFAVISTKVDKWKTTISEKWTKLKEDFQPLIDLVGGFKEAWKEFTEFIKPVIDEIVHYFEVHLIPLYESIQKFLLELQNIVLEGLIAVVGRLTQAWIDSVNNGAQWWLDKLTIIWEAVGKWMEEKGVLTLFQKGLDNIKAAFDGMSGFVDTLKTKLDELILKMQSWELPEWLQEHSTPPVVQALSDMNDLMKDMSNGSLKSFKSALKDMNAGTLIGNVVPTNNSVIYNNQRNITVDLDPHYSTSQSPSTLSRDVQAALLAATF